MEFQIVKSFNEAEGEIQYTVQKKDRILYLFYGEPKYYWRDMKSFDSLVEATRYMLKAQSCIPEVVA